MKCFAYLIAGGVTLAAGAAGAVSFDFESGVAGPIVGTEFAGVAITTTNPNGLALFNSDCGPNYPGTPCTGGDGDLATGPTFGTPPQGLVLINFDGDDGDVGDDASGGKITFAFDRPSIINSIGMIDIDENRKKLKLTFSLTGGGTQMFDGNDFTSNIGSGNNAFLTFAGLVGDPVDTLMIDFQRISGAVAFVDATPVPVPAALPLAAAAFGALCLVARRRARG